MLFAASYCYHFKEVFYQRNDTRCGRTECLLGVINTVELSHIVKASASALFGNYCRTFRIIDFVLT